MDLLLVGRNPDKLRAVAEMIRNKTAGRGRRVITVVADFAEEPVARRGVPCGSAAAADGDRDERRDEPYRDEPDQDDLGDRCHCGASAAGGAGSCARWYPRLRAAVDSRPLRDGGVGVLVNCAGVSYPHPEFFAGMLGDGPAGHGDRDGPWGFTAEFCDGADAAVRCNAAAAVHACRLVLPGMLARGRGLVVNVGSASSSVSPGAPLMTLYAATKKFLEKLSADLDDECVYLNRDNRDGGHGVRVQCVRPAYVATAMLRSANPDVRAAPAADGRGGDCSDSDADLSDHEEYGNEDWWAVRRGRFERAVERWMVPSARRWVRSALRQGGRLYARRTCWPGADGPANFVGYWPHALLMAAMRLASALTPRRWYVDHVLIPGMLKYRRKGRAAVVEAERQREQWRRRSVARSDGRE